MMCGYPCSGKSTIASQIKTFLEGKGKEVSLINFETMHLNRNDIYGQQYGSEKNAHELIKTEVSRVLRSDNYVILDTMNLIKGYRYEMYCIARACRSTKCLVFVDCSRENVKEWNSNRENDKYSDFSIDDLCNRFESPQPSTRWDSPLIHISINNNHLELHGGPEPYDSHSFPFDELFNALAAGKIAPKNKAIAPPVEQLNSDNYLNELSSITESMIKTFISEQKNALEGNTIKLSHGTKYITLYRKVTLPLLRAWRKTYINMMQKKPLPISQVPNSFIDFLNVQLNN
ncbi:hypothetical protein WA158_006674 [Blastocystis sp. Blastoise]